MDTNVPAMPAPARPDEVIERAAALPTDLSPQASAFQKLMQEEPPAPSTGVSAIDGPPSALSTLVSTQDALLRQTFHDAQDFCLRAPTMDLQTLSAQHIRMMFEVVNERMRFSACTYVEQSAKNGIQTLLKNQ